MKKLMMFAAAMTIVGGAYAAACGDCTDDCSCSLIYDFKASLQTTVAKDLKADCGDALCYRQCRKVQWKGYLVFCGACDCESFKAATLIVLDKKSKEVIFDGSTAPTWDILNLVGKGQDMNKNQVEALFDMPADAVSGIEARFAGCGKAADLVVQSINGNVVGKGPGPSCEASCADAVAAFAIPLCGTDIDDTVNAIYHGTWSIKLNKNLSKKGCGCGTDFSAFAAE